MATVSDDPTVVVADLGQQHEKLLPLKQLHYQVHRSVTSVDDELVDPDDVILLQFGYMLELGLEVEDHLVVPGLDYLDGEFPVRGELATPLDQADGALPQDF